MELSAFTNLFQNLQDYVVSILNSDEILQQMGCTFLAENSLDIEYQLKDALNKQGLACVVMTPKATYQGHNGIQQTFTCDELTIQIVENPIINRARLKKEGLDHGTALDVAKQASDRLAGPQGGYFGQFTTKRIQEAEQGGLLVCTATFGCTVYERLDAVISGDLSGKWVEVPFVRTSELSDYIDDYLSTHMPAIEGYLPLSGGEMSGDILFQPNNNIYWGTPDGYDGRINASTPGLIIYNDVEDQWRFKSSVMPNSDYDVLRRLDLSSVDMSGYFPLNLNGSLSVEMGAQNNIEFWRGHAPGEQPIFKIDGVMTTAQYLSARSLGVNQIGVGSNPNLSGILGFNNIYHATPSYGYEYLGNSISAFVDSKLADMMAEVQEDYATYNWINEQDFVKGSSLSGVWKKTDTQLSVGTGAYTTYIDPGAVTIQRLLNGTITKTMQNWDGFTYTISAEGGTPTNYNFTYPLSGGTLATRQYVDAYLGDIESLINLL